MTFQIDELLNSCADSEVRREIVTTHDNLYAAYKIARSVSASVDSDMLLTKEIVLAVFNRLSKSSPA